MDSAGELAMMNAQESLQRALGDAFFGVDKAEIDRKKRMQEMLQEDQESTFREECEHLESLHSTWTQVRDAEAARTRLWIGHGKDHDRAAYMKRFRRATTSDSVGSYDWPATNDCVISVEPSLAGTPISTWVGMPCTSSRHGIAAAYACAMRTL